MRTKRSDGTGAQIFRRLENRRVEPLDRGIDRHHRVGQVDVDETDHHGCFGEQDFQRAGDEAVLRSGAS